MKFLFLCFLFVSNFAYANYIVAKPLSSQRPDCVELKYQKMGGIVSGYPGSYIPKIIQVLADDKKVNFEFQAWYRSYDSLVSVYKSEENEQLTLDDACYDNGHLVSCISYRSCSYRF